MTRMFTKLPSVVLLTVLSLAVVGCTGDLPVSEETKATSDELEVVGDPPKVVVEEEEHNFGSMEVGQTLDHEFVVRNDGEGVLKMKKDRSTCKCTMAEFEEVEVAPGESYSIKLSWIAKAIDPAFSQAAYIKTNDPENKEIELRVVGRVDETFDIEPSGVWALGAMKPGDTTTFEGTVSSRVLDDFKVTDFSAGSEFIDVEFEEFDEAKLKESGAKKGYHIRGKVNPGAPLGRFSDTVEIDVETDDGTKAAVFTVEGYYAGPMQIVGPSGWIASDMTLMLGRFSAAEGKEVTLSIFLRDNDGEPLEITSVESDPEVFDVQLKHDKEFTANNRERYEMTISVPPGSQSVAREKYNPATISVKTNNPLVNEMYIRVIMVSY